MQDIDIPYVSLKHTLGKLKDQVIYSLPYMEDYIPDNITSPEQLFYHLKSLTTYKKDPKGIELLQSVPTLMDRGGRGDCDCFTILTLAACAYMGFNLQWVKLVGKTKIAPSHIYSVVYDPNRKKICSMDLTNAYYCTERPYNYQQLLNVKI